MSLSRIIVLAVGLTFMPACVKSSGEQIELGFGPIDDVFAVLSISGRFAENDGGYSCSQSSWVFSGGVTDHTGDYRCLFDAIAEDGEVWILLPESEEYVSICTQDFVLDGGFEYMDADFISYVEGDIIAFPATEIGVTVGEGSVSMKCVIIGTRAYNAWYERQWY